MKFSQRIGKTPVTKKLQIEGMDESLKNGLWNAFKIHIIDPLTSGISYRNIFLNLFCKEIWANFFKFPIDTVPVLDIESEAYLRAWFFKAEWYKVYDLMEFVITIDLEEIGINSEIQIYDYIDYCNEIFEREFAGYRFINDCIAPITNEHELNEIEEAISHTETYTCAKGANIHLTNSLAKLSDKLNPDYRNSIKESISAVESVAKIISGKSNDSLGAALDKIKGKINMHSALERGFKNLYGYTSDAGGIRHALMDNSTCDFEDAKFMLVSSSAFINYLLVKANKAGIQLN